MAEDGGCAGGGGGVYADGVLAIALHCSFWRAQVECPLDWLRCFEFIVDDDGVWV